MTYQLRIIDNYNYEDSYTMRGFETMADAEQYARSIVNGCLRECLDDAKSPADLLSRFKMFGESPVVLCPSGERSDFDPTDYAKSRAEALWDEKMSSL